MINLRENSSKTMNVSNYNITNGKTDFKPSVENSVISSIPDVTEFLMSQGMSPLPIAPRNEEIFREDGKTLKFTGKNPSWLDGRSQTKVLNHKPYQDKQPTKDNLRDWWKNPLNGIGCLGKENFVWLDLDKKHFESQEACEAAYNKILADNPLLKGAWLERTRSGGYHIGFKIAQPKDSTKFSLTPGGEHVGELLGHGQFCVLAPTDGYVCIQRPLEIPEIESIESLVGICPYSTKPEKADNKSTPPLPAGEVEETSPSLKYSNLVSKTVADLLNFPTVSNTDDVSGLIAKVANEVYGWRNWLCKNEISISESADDIVRDFAIALGRGNKFDRISKTIDSNVMPALWHIKKDAGCHRKVHQALNQRQKYQVDNYSVEETILIDSFLDGEGDISVLDGSFFRYTGNGYHELISDDVVKKFILEELRKLFSIKIIKDKQKIIKNYATDKNISNCLSVVKTALSRFDCPDNSFLRCFSDVTVDLRNGKTLNHSCEHYLKTQIPYPYKLNSECPKIFLDFVEKSYGLELLQLIRASISMCIDPTAPYEKLIHLMGESGSGKGVLLDVITNLVGEAFISPLDVFTDLCSKEKVYQSLTGKSLITFADLVGYQQKVSQIYKIARNEPLVSRPLWAKNDIYLKPNCRILVASVTPINIENSGLGWDGRAITIPSKKAIPDKEKDYGLKKKLQEVSGEIMSWVLAMPREERDYLLQNSTDIQIIKDLKSEIAISTDNTKGFIDSCLVPDRGSKVSLTDLFELYKLWCDKSKYKAIGNRKFDREIKTILSHRFVAYKSGKNSSPNLLEGVKMVGFARGNFNELICDLSRCIEGNFDNLTNPNWKEEYSTDTKEVDSHIESPIESPTVVSEPPHSEPDIKELITIAKSGDLEPLGKYLHTQTIPDWKELEKRLSKESPKNYELVVKAKNSYDPYDGEPEI